MRTGTRLTGWATLFTGGVATLVGLFPLRELPPKRQELWLLCATAACALGWLLASAVARARRRAALRRRIRRRRHEPWPARSSYLLSWVLGFGIAFTSAAALCQGVGPDGADGRWLATLRRAHGGTFEIPVRRIVGEPRRADDGVDDTEAYLSTVVVTVPFQDGARQVTLDGVRTHGRPEAGRTLQLRYVPDRPELGVRQVPDNDIGSFAGRIVVLPALWLLAPVVGLLTALALHRNEAAVRRARRFEPWVHLPAALLLLCGAALVTPLLLGFPSTATGWALAAAAATTPWLALAWVARTS
ncbi:hypothetical protein AB0K09_22430 [Streptomyces sp. NPDC049577]|uniref:hypothetical protein n=1 Tax=Streptomyces sp. NPDC049577 TaxID=3155153 RepID=UPI00343FBF01